MNQLNQLFITEPVRNIVLISIVHVLLNCSKFAFCLRLIWYRGNMANLFVYTKQSCVDSRDIYWVVKMFVLQDGCH